MRVIITYHRSQQQKDREAEIMINLANALNEFGIHFRVPADMIREIIEGKKMKNMEDLTVYFTEATLVLEWKFVRPPFKIPFTLILQPAFTNGRSIYLTVDKFSPINWVWLKRILFQRPPWLRYRDPYLEINLESLKVFQSVPFGTIKSVRIENRSLLVKIGI